MNVEWRQDPNYMHAAVLDLYVGGVRQSYYWAACWDSYNSLWRCKAGVEHATLPTKEAAQAWVLALYSLGVNDEY